MKREETWTEGRTERKKERMERKGKEKKETRYLGSVVGQQAQYGDWGVCDISAVGIKRTSLQGKNITFLFYFTREGDVLRNPVSCFVVTCWILRHLTRGRAWSTMDVLSD